MIDLLVRQPPVVLQHVVVLDALRDGNLLCDLEDLGQLVVRDVVQLGAVVLGDDELGNRC
jgi:hypothetical protein